MQAGRSGMKAVLHASHTARGSLQSIAGINNRQLQVLPSKPNNAKLLILTSQLTIH